MITVFAAIYAGHQDITLPGSEPSNSEVLQHGRDKKYITQQTMGQNIAFSFYAPSCLLTLPNSRVSLAIKSSPSNAHYYGQKLGLRLTVYETTLTDSDHVIIMRERPSLSGELDSFAILANSNIRCASASSNTNISLNVQLDDTKATSFTARCEITPGIAKEIPGPLVKLQTARWSSVSGLKGI